MTTCAWRDCKRPTRTRGVCALHLSRTLAADRRSTWCTPVTARLDRLILARYVTR